MSANTAKSKLLYITSAGIGENIWGTPTIKLLSEYYDLSVLCDANRKNFNFLNKVFGELPFLFCENIDNIFHACCFPENMTEQKEKIIPILSKKINELGFDRFVYNRWQCNKRLKERLHIAADNIIDYVDKQESMWNPRHETLFKLCGGNLSNFESYYAKIKLKSRVKNKNIAIYQGSVAGDEFRKISKELINMLCVFFRKDFPDYNIYVLQNENLELADPSIICIDSKNHKTVYNLLYEGVDLFVGPDSGLRWFAQLFETRNILISEHPRLTKERLTFSPLLPITEICSKDLDKLVELSAAMLNNQQ